MTMVGNSHDSMQENIKEAMPKPRPGEGSDSYVTKEDDSSRDRSQSMKSFVSRPRRPGEVGPLLKMPSQLHGITLARPFSEPSGSAGADLRDASNID